jgi:uncharacterized ion transporter superfamily protein YfcC
MELLNEKNKQQNTNGKRPKCYIFNSFFYTLLSNGGYNYSRVQKWTRKVKHENTTEEREREREREREKERKKEREREREKEKGNVNVIFLFCLGLD